jgi:Na+-transporting NADH:ubiquinone oxidoreductase subunit B
MMRPQAPEAAAATSRRRLPGFRAHFFGPVTAVTLGPPHARSQASTHRLLLWYVIAAVPALGAGLFGQDELTAALSSCLLLLAVSLTVSVFWASLFARWRDRNFDPVWYVAPWLFVLLLPLSTPLWLAAVAMSFGLIFGHHIFGGTGRSLVNPALLGLLFVHFSYPGLAQNSVLLSGVDPGAWWSAAILQTANATAAAPAAASPLACLIGALCLVRVGAASPRTLLGALGGVMFAATLFNLLGEAPANALPWYWHLVLGELAVGVVFIATDPATAALTRVGKWMHGLMVGSLTVLIRVLDPTHPDGTLFAILLAGLTVPLIDYLVVRGHLVRRSRWGRSRGN